MMPPRQSVINSEAYERLVGREAAATARVRPSRMWSLVSAELAEYEDVLQIFYMAVLGVLDGQLTAEEGVDICPAGMGCAPARLMLTVPGCGTVCCGEATAWARPPAKFPDRF